MILTLANVLYVLIAVAMIGLILFQRGSGAAAGAGFGAGASATVFGARGASSFLSKSTAILATLFMVMSLGMAVYASRMNAPSAGADDLGVMEGLEAPAVPVDATVPTLAPNATDVPAGAQVPQASPAAPAAGEAGTDAPAAAAQPQGNGAAAPAAAGSAEAAPADVDADPAPAADAPVQDGNGG